MESLRYAFLTLLAVGIAAALLLRGGSDDLTSLALEPPPPTAEPEGSGEAEATDPDVPPPAQAEPAPAATEEPAPAPEEARPADPALASGPVSDEERPQMYAEVLTLLATTDHPDERDADDPARLLIDPVLILDDSQTEEMSVDTRRAVLDLFDGPARFDDAAEQTGPTEECNADQALVSLAVPFLTEDGGAQMLARVLPDCGGSRVVGYTFAPVLGGDGYSVVAAEILDDQPA